jgi:importin subunit beta-1
MAAGTCIGLLAQAVGDAIVQPIIPFIESNIKNADWHYREAAVMAFGSILDGPDPEVIKPLTNQALPILIEMMRDENVAVKDTTAWTLGRICELLIQVITPEAHLHPLVSSLVGALDDQPRIVANACWALNALSEGMAMFGDDDEMTETTPPTSPLSPYYDVIVSSILRLTEKCATISLSFEKYANEYLK